jgi:tetratricopeptide (TPR) repeat protein
MFQEDFMKTLFVAFALFCAVPAFAETELSEAPKIASDKQQLENDRQEAKKENKAGLSFLKQKKFFEAIDAFYRATELDPDNAHYHNQYGLAALKSEDPFTAINEFTLALELGLTKAFVWNNLGMAYEHTNQLDEARNAYLKASQKGSTAAEKNYLRIKNVKSLNVRASEGFGCGGEEAPYPPIILSTDPNPEVAPTPEVLPTPTPEAAPQDPTGL